MSNEDIKFVVGQEYEIVDSLRTSSLGDIFKVIALHHMGTISQAITWEVVSSTTKLREGKQLRYYTRGLPYFKPLPPELKVGEVYEFCDRLGFHTGYRVTARLIADMSNLSEPKAASTPYVIVNTSGSVQRFKYARPIPRHKLQDCKSGEIYTISQDTLDYIKDCKSTERSA